MGSIAESTREAVFDLLPSWNELRWDVAEELFQPDWDNGPDLPSGPSGVRAGHESTVEAFPSPDAL